tara:strand:- start:264 stop:806 length:543 start_codon:yes stop_codon:yes gene_type:complete
MSIKTIFLDRDGVINKEINYLHTIKNFEFIEGVFETCSFLQSLDYKIIIITNQSGIARGYSSIDDFEILTNWMVGQFKKREINILDVFYCPHLPDGNCNCRKPKPGMFLEAQLKYNIDMSGSWMIGDKEDDITAAISAGINKTILVKSGHKIRESESNAKYIIESIHQAGQLIVKEKPLL